MRLFLTALCFTLVLTTVSACFDKKQTFPENEWLEVIVLLFDPETQAKNKPVSPAPPAIDKTETDYVHLMVSSRTPEQAQRFKAMYPDPLQDIFDAIGLRPDQYGATQLLIYQGMNTLNTVLYGEKWRYQRPRPQHVIEGLSTLDNHPGTASYPADQAAQARMAALILSDLFPAYDYAFTAWADDIGRLNEIAGLQFASDTQAGHDVARRVYADYKETSFFKESRLEAEIELIDFEPNLTILEERLGPLQRPAQFP